MNETSSRWDDLSLFLAVARAGGLSSAAPAAGRSAATLGRRMHALERAIGRELFIRHDRGYELTTEGRALMEELTEIEGRIGALTRPAQDALPLVKVSAGTWTTLALLDKLDDIIGTPPDIRLRIVSVEQVLDIPKRQVMIGFRNRRPKEPGLAGRKLSRVEFAAFAKHDAPRRWIKVMSDTPSAKWLETSVGHDCVCEVTAPRNGLDLALAGKGMALIPTFIGDLHPTLTRIGEPVAALSHDRWIVTHQDDRHLPEIRRTLDRLCAALDTRPLKRG